MLSIGSHRPNTRWLRWYCETRSERRRRMTWHYAWTAKPYMLVDMWPVGINVVEDSRIVWCVVDWRTASRERSRSSRFRVSRRTLAGQCRLVGCFSYNQVEDQLFRVSNLWWKQMVSEVQKAIQCSRRVQHAPSARQRPAVMCHFPQPATSLGVSTAVCHYSVWNPARRVSSP